MNGSLSACFSLCVCSPALCMSVVNSNLNRVGIRPCAEVSNINSIRQLIADLCVILHGSARFGSVFSIHRAVERWCAGVGGLLSNAALHACILCWTRELLSRARAAMTTPTNLLRTNDFNYLRMIHAHSLAICRICELFASGGRLAFLRLFFERISHESFLLRSRRSQLPSAGGCR